MLDIDDTFPFELSNFWIIHFFNEISDPFLLPWIDGQMLVKTEWVYPFSEIAVREGRKELIFLVALTSSVSILNVFCF